MIEVPVGHLSARIDDEDAALVQQYSWYLLYAGHSASSTWYYAARNWYEDGVAKIQTMHKLILDNAIGIDHKDRDSLNNQRSNLRIATPRQNSWNQAPYKIGSCMYKGVSVRGKSWRAQYTNVDGQKIHLGSFNDPKLAALAYDAAIEKFQGEFAWLNRDHFDLT